MLGDLAVDRQKLIVGFPDEETRRRWVVAFVGRSFQIKRWQVGIKAVAELQGQDVAQRESLYKNVNVGIEQQRKIVDRACDKAQGRLVPTHSKNGMVFEDTQVPAPRPLRRSPMGVGISNLLLLALRRQTRRKKASTSMRRRSSTGARASFARAGRGIEPRQVAVSRLTTVCK